MTSLKHTGQNRRLALYTGRGKAVVVDTKYMTASVVPDGKTGGTWRTPTKELDPLVGEIASAALVASSGRIPDPDLENGFRRGYTVPAAVQKSARSVLGSNELSPMSRRAATLLAAGGQVSCADALWVHRFFEYSGGKGDADPAKLAAWGGQAGRVWAGNLASRLEYDSVVADAGDYFVHGLEPFTAGDEESRAFWGRVTDHGHVDSVFRKDDKGNEWLCWGNGYWFAAEPPKNLTELDDESALYACGALLDAPDKPVNLWALDAYEWQLANVARKSLDWEALDRVMTAAAAGNGEYTPEERSENASSQLRDANGRFAKVGDTGLMKSGLRGTISTVNSQGNQVVVNAEDGNSYMIEPGDFTIDGGVVNPSTGAGPAPAAGNGTVENVPRLDLTGILGQPRASQNTPKAFLKNMLQPMGPKQIKQVVTDYEAFIKAERQKRAKDFKGGTGWQESKAPTAEDRAREKAAKKARDEAQQEYESFVKKYAFKRSPIRAAATEDDVPVVDQPAQTTPDNSDVPPMYMAIVDPEDPRAVLELVSLVPAGPTSEEATTFKRLGGEWVADPKIMQNLRSATPPPVVMLEEEEYTSVLEQVDNEPVEPEGSEPADTTTTASGRQVVLSLAAAGGADRNRGNAETLRRYWTKGKGGAKIRWNTGGDWRRCVRYLKKHLGPGAKGYCALRHKEMTGMWPGDRRNRKDYSLSPEGAVLSSLDDLKRTPAVIRAAGFAAEVETALAKIRGDKLPPVPVKASDVDEGRSGRAFVIPIVVPEGISSGDKRHFLKGSLGVRSLPLPLLWQPFTGEGHDGSPIVGRIDRVERTSAGLGNAYGVFDTGPYGREAQRLVENNMLRWISVDLDKFEVDEDLSEIDPDGKMNIKKGRMMAATLVSKPAFQECTLELLPLDDETEEPDMPSTPTITAAAGISTKIPVEPPDPWFDRPVLNGPTPIRVTDEGQVYGHVATWETSHVGLPGSTKPPRSASDYAYFHTGLVRTNGGKDVKVGQLTLSGGHADLNADATAAAKHYDDTASAIADVHAGEDSYGIWVAGALRPGTTPEQIRAFRASAPSGDWRFIQGVGLEMIAVCQVNVPGFPVPQTMVASGQTNALVAAGTADLIAIQAMERSTPAAQAEALKQRLYGLLDVDGYIQTFKDFPKEKRDELAKDGKALDDGSFPIENVSDLRRAIQAYGRASKDKKAKVRRHIVKRARALGKKDMIPGNWREASLSTIELDKRDHLLSLVASARTRQAQQLADRINRPTLESKAAELAARIGR